MQNSLRLSKRWVRASQAIGMGKEIAKFLNPQIIVNGWKVGHVTEGPTGVFRFVENRHVIYENFAIGRFQKRGNGFDGGGFSSPVRTDESVDSTFFDRKGQVVDGDEFAVVNLEILDADHESSRDFKININRGQLFLA